MRVELALKGVDDAVEQLAWFLNAYTLTFAAFMLPAATLGDRLVSGLGVAVGPVVGGAIVDGISWQAIFWVNVPVAAIAVGLLLAAVSESRGATKRLDLVGTLLVGGAVLLATWGIVHGNDDGWTSPAVITSLAGGVALLAAYLPWAARRTDAVLPLRLFRSRSFSAANAAALLFTLGMFGAVFLLSQYLQIVHGYSPLEAGIRTLPWTAAPMVVAPLAGLLAPRVGVRALLVTGAVAVGTAVVAAFFVPARRRTPATTA